MRAVGSAPVASPAGGGGGGGSRAESLGAPLLPRGASVREPVAAAPCGEVGAGLENGAAAGGTPWASCKTRGAATGPYGGREDVQVEGKPQS